MDQKQRVEVFLGQVADPEEFLAKVQEMNQERDAESIDVIHFKGGRIFERYSLPQRRPVRAPMPCS